MRIRKYITEDDWKGVPVVKEETTKDGDTIRTYASTFGNEIRVRKTHTKAENGEVLWEVLPDE